MNFGHAPRRRRRNRRKRGTTGKRRRREERGNCSEFPTASPWNSLISFGVAFSSSFMARTEPPYLAFFFHACSYLWGAACFHLNLPGAVRAPRAHSVHTRAFPVPITPSCVVDELDGLSCFINIIIPFTNLNQLPSQLGSTARLNSHKLLHLKLTTFYILNSH